MSPAQTKLRALRDRQSTERGRMADARHGRFAHRRNSAANWTPSRPARRTWNASCAPRRWPSTRKSGRRRPPPPPSRTPRHASVDELRSRAKVGGYLVAALRGRAPSGAEAEFAQAEGVDGIPFSLWQPPPAHGGRGTRDHRRTRHGGNQSGRAEAVRLRAKRRHRPAHGRYADGGQRHLCERHDHDGRHGGRGAEGWHRHDRRRAGNRRRLHGADHDAAPDRRQSQSGNRGHRSGGPRQFRVPVAAAHFARRER